MKEINLRNNFCFMAMVLLLATVLIFSGQIGVQANPRTDLNWGRGTDATTLDPRMARDVYSHEINMLIYDELFYIDHNQEIQLLLAKSLEYPDDTTYLFTLHEGVLFHDGEELTAEDVVYTFETMMDPDFGSPHYDGLQPIESVKALDRYTVEIKAKEPDAVLIYDLDHRIVPKHIAPDSSGGDFAYKPVGTGPFMLERWEPNDVIVLTRYEDYFRGPAQLETINVRYIPEAEVRFTDLLGGALDLSDVPTEELDRMREHPDFTVGGYTTLNYFPIFVQHDHEILSQKKVRQALAYGMDLDELVEVVFETAIPATSCFIPDTWAYAPEVQRTYDYNPEKAKELLAEAGYPDGFSITLKTSTGTTNVEFGEILRYYWLQIGVDLEHQTSEWSTYFSALQEGDFELAHSGMVNAFDPDIFLRRYHSGNIPPYGANRGHYKNPDLDRIIDEARRIVGDQEARAELYREAQKIYTEELPNIPVRYTQMHMVWDADFEFEWLLNTQFRVLLESYWKE